MRGTRLAVRPVWLCVVLGGAITVLLATTAAGSSVTEEAPLEQAKEIKSAKAKKAEVLLILRKLGMSYYWSRLNENGVDDLDDLALLTMEDLQATGLKIAHARRLKSFLSDVGIEGGYIKIANDMTELDIPEQAKNFQVTKLQAACDAGISVGTAMSMLEVVSHLDSRVRTLEEHTENTEKMFGGLRESVHTIQAGLKTLITLQTTQAGAQKEACEKEKTVGSAQLVFPVARGGRVDEGKTPDDAPAESVAGGDEEQDAALVEQEQ